MTHTESEYKGWTSQVHLHLAQQLSQSILARPPSLRTWTLYCCWSLGHTCGSRLHLCCHTHLCLHTTASARPNHCSFDISWNQNLCPQIMFCFKLFGSSSSFPCPYIFRIIFYTCSKNFCWEFFRQGLIMQPRLFSNSWSSWLSCPSTGIAGMYHIPYTEIFITNTVDE